MKYADAAVLVGFVAFFIWALEGRHIFYARTTEFIIVKFVY